jgi:hypothetical protein
VSKRIAAIVFIFICTSIAWAVLSMTVLVRTETQDSKLRDAVGKLWGTEHIQLAPSLFTNHPQTSKTPDRLPLDTSNINVNLALEYRQKGLLWYSTYRVKFSGKYTITNNSDQASQLYFDFPLPARGAVYDNFRLIIAGEELKDIVFNESRIIKAIQLSPRQSKEIEISYESQGLDRWYYDFGNNVSQINNFSLVLNTNFENIDFPDNTMAPVAKEHTASGWRLTWKYDKLLTDVKIGLAMPEKLNPGPWATKVTAAAPVSLFLYFFLLFVLTTVKKIKIHPMNFFFIGAAFFSFHLLLAYLVDHISIHLAFWICSAVSVFLVISYMRLVVGLKIAFVEISLSQLVYLVFFSYTFFFKGYTGLTITILCICTLFIVMQFTGRVDWEKLFEKPAMPQNQETKS